MEKIPLLRDALYYTLEISGASCDKAQGVVVGMVTALMGYGNVDVYEAFEIIKAHLPDGYRTEAIPEAWRDAL